MPRWVNETAKRVARTVNLYDFLLSRHSGDVVREGNSLRLRDNHSVSVKRGYCGFTDFSNGSTGNSVDCLINFLGYGFMDAVAALCEFAGIADIDNPAGIHIPATMQNTSQKALQTPQNASEASGNVFIPPEPLRGSYKRLYAYLTQTRGIPASLVHELIDDQLLYQEDGTANMVFIDPARTFAELRGTNTSKSFHKVMFSDVAAFWWFKPRGLFSNPMTAYICEGAVDAISLYVLLSSDSANRAYDGLYCSIGGVANHQRIDRIIASMSAAGCQTVIAVDNDDAGAKCRQRYPSCKSIIPYLKDWNEDLLKYENDPGYAFHDIQWIDDVILNHRRMG